MSIDNKKIDLHSVNEGKSEFRQDLVSSDWILVAVKRLEYSKKNIEKKKSEIKKKEKTVLEIQKEIESCPFEDPQKSGNGAPILMFNKNGDDIKNNFLSSYDIKKRLPSATLVAKRWFTQIIINKNPAIETDYFICPEEKKEGPFSKINAVGFHEVVITYDHNRKICDFSNTEIKTLIKTYKERFLQLMNEKCLKYILIFQNSGKEAGASVQHPHSQILATPIVPPDVVRSLNGCNIYFEKYKKCVHCEMIVWELKKNKRIIYQNSEFIALCPYASHFNFEIRIFPLKHKKNFELIQENEIEALSDVFKQVFGKIRNKLQNPAYNFFIHTAPINYIYDYHWHIEILPRISIWGGFELGTGIEVIVIPPEKARDILNN